MKKMKGIVSAVLVLALCFTGTGVPGAFTGVGSLIPGKMISYAEEASSSQSPVASGSEHQSFVFSTESQIEAPDYYAKQGNNKAQYTDRNNEVQYRVYGTPEEGTTGWYVADEQYIPDERMIEAGDDTEYRTLAPLQYSIYGETASKADNILQIFLDANPDFKDTASSGLASEYEMVWDAAYNAPYLVTDAKNVYQAKGAFALKRKADGETAIYYIAYGQIMNDGPEGSLQWFMFDKNTGYRYQFTYTAGSLSRTLRGAAATENAVIKAPVTLPGYRKPEDHTLQGGGDSWTFTYEANEARLAVYSYDAKADKKTALTYDQSSVIADEDQAAHSGYALKYYCYPAD